MQVQSGGEIPGGGQVNARFLNNATYALAAAAPMQPTMVI